MSNDPNCPFGSKPLSPEAQAQHDRDTMFSLRATLYEWHEKATELGFDGVASMLDELELRGIRSIPV